MAFSFYSNNNKNKIKPIHQLSDNKAFPINQSNEYNQKARDLETICKELEKICQHIEVIKSQKTTSRPYSKGYATYTNFLPRISKRKSLCCPDEYISKVVKKKQITTPKTIKDNSLSTLKLPYINQKQVIDRHRTINNVIRQSKADVKESTGRIRIIHNKRPSLASKDRIPLKGDTVCNGIKSRSPTLKSIHDRTSPEIGTTNRNKTSNISYINGATSTASLHDTMATLTLDNRHDMGSNDHAKHHNKRRQQWLRSEQLKNWSRSTHSKLTKKNSCGTSASSGQKSDVISGNSDESTHTTSSSSEYRENVIEEPMDLEMRETFNKCMRWMETLPTKFSGMHLHVQPSET